LKTIFKGQIQHQNEKIKVFNSSFTRINMPMNEHLMYQTIMVS
jgi:hypothetical protein